jgi:hypothetical protein
MTKVSIDSNYRKELIFSDLVTGDFFTTFGKMYIKLELNGLPFAANLKSGIILDCKHFAANHVIKHNAVEIKVTE